MFSKTKCIDRAGRSFRHTRTPIHVHAAERVGQRPALEAGEGRPAQGERGQRGRGRKEGQDEALFVVYLVLGVCGRSTWRVGARPRSGRAGLRRHHPFHSLQDPPPKHSIPPPTASQSSYIRCPPTCGSALAPGYCDTCIRPPWSSLAPPTAAGVEPGGGGGGRGGGAAGCCIAPLPRPVHACDLVSNQRSCHRLSPKDHRHHSDPIDRCGAGRWIKMSSSCDCTRFTFRSIRPAESITQRRLVSFQSNARRMESISNGRRNRFGVIAVFFIVEGKGDLVFDYTM